MDLIGPEMSWAKIRVIYNEVYQLWKLPDRSPCDEETGEKICQKILDSVKECLQHGWVPAQPEKELKWSPTSTSKTDAQAEFQARPCAFYDHFKNMQQKSCQEALAMARDAHWQTLVAVALLEENIKWLSCPITCGWSGSCQLSGSHQHSGSHRCLGSCRRSQSTGCQKQVPSAASCSGDSVKRCMHSPSPTQPRQQVTFEESSPERETAVQELPPSTLTTEDTSDWSQPVEGDLMCPSLDPLLEDFLGGEMPPLGVKGGDGFWWRSRPEPSLKNSSEWVMQWADQVDTLTWWPELSAVPGERDVKEFSRKVWALFKLPMRMSCTLSISNDYSTASPHALGRNWFLLIRNMHFRGKDYRLEQPEHSSCQKEPCHHAQTNSAN